MPTVSYWTVTHHPDLIDPQQFGERATRVYALRHRLLQSAGISRRMRCTVPVPSPTNLAVLSTPVPLATVTCRPWAFPIRGALRGQIDLALRERC
jgi:hypothetical protein